MLEDAALIAMFVIALKPQKYEDDPRNSIIFVRDTRALNEGKSSGNFHFLPSTLREAGASTAFALPSYH